jgi:hypothetical protein
VHVERSLQRPVGDEAVLRTCSMTFVSIWSSVRRWYETARDSAASASGRRR